MAKALRVSTSAWNLDTKLMTHGMIAKRSKLSPDRRSPHVASVGPPSALVVAVEPKARPAATATMPTAIWPATRLRSLFSLAARANFAVGDAASTAGRRSIASETLKPLLSSRKFPEAWVPQVLWSISPRSGTGDNSLKTSSRSASGAPLVGIKGSVTCAAQPEVRSDVTRIGTRH